MNDRKICFIACVNDDDFFSECLLYISRLYIPNGFELDVLSIKDADSMTQGYNKAMQASDAKYKIYLHQDTFITDRFFLQEMVDIFTLDPTIGMLGIVGTPKMPDDGCMWNAERIGDIYDAYNSDIGKTDLYSHQGTYDCISVEAIDGFLMATQYDIPWRDDLFVEFDFYDASQSKEFIRKGYKVIVPIMNKPVCVHDDGVIVNLLNYDNNRKKFLIEHFDKNEDK